MKKLILGFATIALAVASAATHKVTLFQTSNLGGQELKAGEYKIEVTDNKAVIKDGKKVVTTDVKVETEGQKFASTSIRYTDGSKVSEIRLGGTNTKLVFAN